MLLHNEWWIYFFLPGIKQYSLTIQVYDANKRNNLFNASVFWKQYQDVSEVEGKQNTSRFYKQVLVKTTGQLSHTTGTCL